MARLYGNALVIVAEDANGSRVPEAQLFLYVNNTTTPQVMYSDSAMATETAFPAIADGAGSFGPIYCLEGTYTIDVTDANGDSLPGYPANDWLIQPAGFSDLAGATAAAQGYAGEAQVSASEAEALRELTLTSESNAALSANQAASAALAAGAPIFGTTAEFLASGEDHGFVPENNGYRHYENVSGVATPRGYIKEAVYSSVASLLSSLEGARGAGAIWTVDGPDGLFKYEEAASGVVATADDMVTAADVLLYPIPSSEGSINVMQTGARGVGVGHDDTLAFKRALNAKKLAVIRDEYASTPKVIVPLVDAFYHITSDIVVRRNVIIEGAGGPGRGLGATKIKFADTCEAGFWFAAPGGYSAPSPYDTEVGADFYGAGRSIMRDLTLMPVNDGGVDFGVVHNLPCTFERVHVEKFRLANWFAHGQTSGGSDYGDPNGIGGAGTMWGNTNGSLYLLCNGFDATEGHGFVAQGNNTQVMMYMNCDATRNKGCGFRDNSSIGNAYVNCHTAQNTIKTAYAGTATAQLTSDVVAYAGNTVEVTDGTLFTSGEIVMVPADAGQDNAGQLAAVVSVSGNTLTLADTLKMNSSTGSDVYKDVSVHMPIKPHVSDTSNNPKDGADKDEFWIEVISTLPDVIWESGHSFRDAGGINIVDTGGNFPTIFACYTEAGIEYGVIPRGKASVSGGNVVDNRCYSEGPDADSVGVLNGLSATPHKWTGYDDTYEWGSRLGTSRRVPTFFECGHSDDPDSTQVGTDGISLAYSPIRHAYEWSKDNTRVMSFTADGWAGSPYADGGHVYFEDGILLGGPKTSRLRATYSKATIPVGTVEKGEYFFSSNATAGSYALYAVTTGGTVGSTAVIKSAAAINS